MLRTLHIYIIIISLLAFGTGGRLFAQDDIQNLKRAEDYIRQAAGYYAQAQYNEAIKEYQFAAAIYRRMNRFDLYGVCYNGVGNCYIEMTRYKEALGEFNRVLALYKEMGRRKADLKVDSLVISDAYEGIGRYYMNVEVDYKKAMLLHQDALQLRLTYGRNPSLEALSYYFIGLCYRGFAFDSTRMVKEGIENPIEKELEYLQKALKIQLKSAGENHYQTADTYAALGDYYYELKQDYQKGFDFHQKALAIREKVFREDHPKIAASYLDFATYYRVMNMFDREQEYLEKGLSIQLNILGEEHKDIAKSYFLLGNRNYYSGDYDKALDYYQRAASIFQKLQGEYSVEVAEVYLKIALSHRAMGDHRLESTFLFKTLNVQHKIYGKKHFKLGETMIEIGTYFGEIQAYDSLLHYYETATELWVEQLGEDHYLVAKAYDNLAQAHRTRGEYEKEFYYLNEALAKKQNVKDLGNSGAVIRESQEVDLLFEAKEDENIVLGTELYNSYMNLAAFYKRNKDYQLALIYVQNALTAVCTSLPKPINIYKNPSITELSHNIDWLTALEEKGSLFLNLYTATKDKKELNFAHETYLEALALIDTLRINFSSDGSKQQLTIRSIPVYEGAIEVLHTLYNSSKNPKYLYQAFEVMERSKGFVLLQALQGIAARNFSDVPSELLAREEHLRRNLAYYSDFKNRGKNNEEDFDKSYFNTRQQYDSLVYMLESNYPRYYALKYKNTVVSLKELQQKILNNQNVLLEYFIGDEHIYVFKITADYQYFYKISIPKDFERMVTNLRNALTDYQMIAKDPKLAYKNFVIASNSFYKTFAMQFLTGVDPSVNKLIIIPDGWLNYIPFEILLEETPNNFNEVDYSNLAYLIKRYEINYSYSATLLMQNMEPKKHKNNGKCIGFAPSYKFSKTMGADADLPWAEKELNAVQENLLGEYFFGLEATKDAFRERATNYGVIHLAMHGIVNLRNSQKSILAFARASEEIDEEETHLFAYEIHNMSLNADLVVLSACETGFGKVVRGEGVLRVARAFMYAGVPSVVTTLWKVNDYTSATLMTYFYKNLSRGMSKPEALRQAKLTYLEQSDQISGHPAFWASFISIGNPDPIRYGFPSWVWITIGVGGTVLLSMLVAMLIGKRRRKRKNAVK